MSFTTIVLVVLFVVTYNDEVNGQPILDTRVIGGHNATKGEFPHLVSIQLTDNTFRYHTCGGTIINDRWVLTAAHCFKGTTVIYTRIVVAGKHNLHAMENTQQEVMTEKIITHEKFDILRGFQNDIALLKLKKPWQFNNAVKPIDMPEPGSIPKGIAILAGWGLTHHSPNVRPTILQTTNVPLIDHDSCQKAVLGYGPMLTIFDSNICTGPLTGGHAACDGDSGGPLIQTNSNGKNEIIGISSWTLKPCGRIGSPTVYTRVSAHLDWIHKIIMSY